MFRDVPKPSRESPKPSRESPNILRECGIPSASENLLGSLETISPRAETTFQMRQNIQHEGMGVLTLIQSGLIGGT